MKRLVVIISGALLIANVAALATANSFGLNFTATRFGGGPYPILSNGSAGIVPQANWNNTNPVANGTNLNIASPIAGTVTDNTGAATGVIAAWSNVNAEVNSDGGNTTPNERLYRGVIEGLGVGQSPLTITVSNIPYPKYEVIAYLAGFGFDADASVQLGGEHFYYIQSSDFTTDGFIQATATSHATQTLATYAVFENQTSSSFSLQVFTEDGNRGSIAGIQVIGVPEPGTWCLAAMGYATCLLASWKKVRRRRKLAARPTATGCSRD